MNARVLSRYLFLATALLLPPTHASADFTGPGKNSAYASTEATPLPAAATAILAANIEKGKSKRVLEITATLQVGGAASYPGMFVQVNGMNLVPTNVLWNSLGGTCPGSCLFSGTWWLDLDAAETAAPGTIVGQTLQAVLYAQDFYAAGVAYTSTMSVRMEKK